MPVQRPSQALIEAVVDKLLQAISENNYEPTSVLQLSERTLLVDLCATDEPEAAHLVNRLRGAARSAGWNERRVTGLNLKAFERRARARLNEEQKAEKISAAAQKSARHEAKKQRNRQGIAAALQEYSIKDMIEQDDSLLLIAIGHLLQKRAGRIWFDTFHLCAMSDWDGTSNTKVIEPRAIDDTMDVRILVWLHTEDARLGSCGVQTVLHAVSDVAQRDKRNEPVDRLKALVWDKTERLKLMFVRGFGTTDTAFHREVARCWMVSMVARVRKPGCKVDTLPVFQGGEGVAKSKALRMIGGKFHREATAMAGDKDFLQQMIGAMLFEVAELHSLSGRGRNVERIKQTITNEDDHFRAPYERKPSNHPRTCVWCGTTNDEEWFAEGGPGRRFWSILCALIDLPWLEENMVQLWAEAAYYESLGTDDPKGCWWNFPEDEQRLEIERVRQETTYQSKIERRISMLNGSVYLGNKAPGEAGYVAPTSAVDMVPDPDRPDYVETIWGTLLTTERIAFEFLGMKSEEQGRNHNAQQIGAAMRAMGFAKDKLQVIGSKRWVRFWTLEKRRDIEIHDADVNNRRIHDADVNNRSKIADAKKLI